MIDYKPRSYNYYDRDANRVFVKKQTSDTWVKVTQWNAGCVKTVYTKVGGPDSQGHHQWRKIQDRVAVGDWVNLDKGDCVVIVHR